MISVMSMMDFSKKLAEAMSERKISTRHLSELTGIPKSAIQRYTSGDTEKIPIDRMKLMAEAMGIDPAYVMGWASDANSKISKHLGSDSPAVKQLRKIGDHFTPSPLLKEIDEALSVSPQLEIMTKALLHMSPIEQQKMVDVGKAMFPEHFDVQ
mgnify:CR=1 FL=1